MWIESKEFQCVEKVGIGKGYRFDKCPWHFEKLKTFHEYLIKKKFVPLPLSIFPTYIKYM